MPPCHFVFLVGVVSLPVTISIAADPARPTFSVTPKQIEALPKWGAIRILDSDLRDDVIHNVNIGAAYSDRGFRGTVQIVNGSSQNIKVSDVVTDCSCTSFSQRGVPIEQGEQAQYIVFEVNRAELGDFTVNVSLKLNDFTHQIKLSGKVKARIEASNTRIEFNSDGIGRIVLQIVDPELIGKVNGAKIIEGGATITTIDIDHTKLALELRVDNSRAPKSTIVVVPVIGSKDGPPISFPVLFKGRFLTLPKTSHVSRQSEVFRIFVTGDTNAIGSENNDESVEDEVSGCSKGGKHFSRKCEFIVRYVDSSMISLTTANPYTGWLAGWYEASLTIRDKSIPFQLQLRD